MGAKVLVTGATGKVGYEVVKALSAAGVAVKAATRHPAAAPDFGTGSLVEVVRFDYDNPAAIAAALAEIDLYGVIRAGAAAVLTPDVAQVLGRAPIPFDQYARDYAAFWRTEA